MCSVGLKTTDSKADWTVYQKRTVNDNEKYLYQTTQTNKAVKDMSL